MKYLRVAFLALILIAAVACSKKPKEGTAAPAAEPAKVEQAAPAPTPAVPAASSKTSSQMHPCKISNVDDKACTNDLSKELATLLISQGETEKAANDAGAAIASAIKTAPLDKRNGFKMKGLESGKPFTFIFQNEGGKCYLQLFNKRDDSENFEILGSKKLPACKCKD